MPYKNPEDRKRRDKERRTADPEKCKKQWADWRQANLEYNRTRQVNYAEQKRSYAKRNYAENKDAELARNKAYVKANPEKVFAIQRRRSFNVKIHLKTVERHAREKKVACDLRNYETELQTIFNTGVCELSGLPFSDIKFGSRRPYVPSIDRIKPELGYVRENVRVVLWALNTAMGTWGLEELLKIINAVQVKRGTL